VRLIVQIHIHHTKDQARRPALRTSK
jgi:hypothetical protein